MRGLLDNYDLLCKIGPSLLRNESIREKESHGIGVVGQVGTSSTGKG